MKLKLRKWVKVVIYVLFLLVFSLITRDLFKHKTVVNEVGKHYVCYGSVIQVCSGETYE